LTWTLSSGTSSWFGLKRGERVRRDLKNLHRSRQKNARSREAATLDRPI
jgi:hypothetical protein